MRTLSSASRDVSTTAGIQMQAKVIFPNGKLAVNQAKTYANFVHDETTINNNIYRFQNVFLRCPTRRLHCFLSFHWSSFRFLSFMALLIPSIQFFFGLFRAVFCFGIRFTRWLFTRRKCLKLPSEEVSVLFLIAFCLWAVPLLH